MRKILSVTIENPKEGNTDICFGEANEGIELLELQKLRYLVYKEKGYYGINEPPSGLDIDRYDSDRSTCHLIVETNSTVVGATRILFRRPLPTEVFFDFERPSVMSRTKPTRIAEVGRLVIAPKKTIGKFLPRNLALLFLIKSMLSVAEERNILFSFAFLKEGIRNKIKKLKIPVHYIDNFTQRYDKDGAMAGYFFSEKDIVTPAYFDVKEMGLCINKTLGNKTIFQQVGDKEYKIKYNTYTRFLRLLQII